MSEHISEHSEKLVREIKQRAWLFVQDNPNLPREAQRLHELETAMLLGASIALQLNESAIQLQAWHESFGTTQLTHALARLQVAERAQRELGELKPHPMIPMPCCEREETRTSKCFKPRR